jgi:hypothetical protein
VYPAETLEFEVTSGAPEGTTYPTITVGTNNQFEVDGTTNTYTIPVNVPDANAYKTLGAGRYHYTVKETGAETTSQAVIYDTTKTFNVDVYAYYDTNKAFVREAVIYAGTEDTTSNPIPTKDDDFENTYEVGELEVKKTISGNLADPEKEFEIEVTLSSANNVASDLTFSGTATAGDVSKNWTSKTIKFKLKGGDTFTIGKIPMGVTYTIKENGITNITAEQQIEKANDLNAYTITGQVETAKAIGKAKASEEITNTKGITVPTGIALDTLPYVLILAVAVIGLAKLGLRKREEY